MGRARLLLVMGAMAAITTTIASLAAPAARAADDALPGQSNEALESSRRERENLKTPLSQSSVDREEIQRGKPNVQADEAVELVPGVFTQSAPNFAQDARVSIRGFGARAPFGIRGVKVLVDGIPTTLPDGQSEVDSIDLAFVERTDVVRGPVSSLYGGGGGGVISFQTLSPTVEPEARVRTLFGAYGLQRYEATTTGTAGGFGYMAGYTSTVQRGYRRHSAARQQVGMFKLERELDSGTLLRANLSGVWAPKAQDPGGLNQGEVDFDRRAARPGAVRLNTGEELDQQKIALDVAHPFGEEHSVRVRGYYLHRDFENRLPFTNRGQVKLARNVGGASAVYDGAYGPLEWLAGLDVDQQSDVRRRYDNISGIRGPLQFDQGETVRNLGGFGELELHLPHGFGLVGGGRYDWLEYVAADRFLIDGDQSDRFRLREFSPRVGAYYQRSPRALVFANLLTAFRPPTTTELAFPDQGGFRTDLDAETARGVEVGIKGLIGERLFVEAAGYYLDVRDLIVPFEDTTGRTLSRNAGESRRVGFELGLGARLRPGLEVRAAYTYSDFIYRDYEVLSLVAPVMIQSFKGNREPGTPVHHVNAELRYDHRSGFWSVLAVRFFTEIDVNDQNTAVSDGATVSDIRMGYDWRRGSLLLSPFVSLRNWVGTKYDGQLRPNAVFGRYYEPAPTAEWLAGIEIRWGREP